ncbi:GTPase [Nocardiopsis sp. MG754419]|uniref:GTPase n=1 Tax=Nocardiopsis sp. MG754419 TaxID=2259865 RepID=UPI001BAA12E8|nr:GTPase [Nocardiopsis sp. MG754419]MBR8744039.1 hypothetical protein [Nocardiopsis sp. MG754419]
MTTQWNPAQAGDAGPGETHTSGEDTDRESASSTGPWADDTEPEPYQSGPWRGYTMPVPEHPEHARERIRGAEEPAAYDGITGYPDPSGAGAALGGLQKPAASPWNAQGDTEDAHGTEPERAREPEQEPAHGTQRRFGRHSRSAAAPGGAGRRAATPSGEDDDPENLAGWVGSLSEAADDTRIAGRHTGSFPIIRPETAEPAGERKDAEETADASGTAREHGASERAEREDRRAEDDRVQGARSEDTEVDNGARERTVEAEGPWDTSESTSETVDRRGARPAPGVVRTSPDTTWVGPGNGDDEPVAASTDVGDVLAPAFGDNAFPPGAQRLGGGVRNDGGADDRADEDTAARADAPAGESNEAAPDDDAPPPLPRRIPGPSAVSGAFRAIGADTPATGAGEHGTGIGPGTGAGADTSDTAQVTDPAEPEDDTAFADTDEEYRPTNHDRWLPTSTTTRAELIERLDSLSTLVEIGKDDLPDEVLGRAGQLLDHAGARLRLSGDHTVVALAGGTGSGKSSLFNALCGLELSQTGVTRPTTSKAHACVWGHEGADALLSWLGVPDRYRHSRTSVLDSGDSGLTGLVLLDLPDHDSVRSMHTAEADRLIGSVDLLVWVLDPQKYADAAIHHRYLAKMAGHGAVTVAVLNQVDKVEPAELEELLTDLRRLLETESGVHPRVITTSTITDQGIDELREFLSETVTDKRALVDRLVADLDQVIEPFEEFHGENEVPETVSAQVRSRIQQGLADAAGVSAVADVVETNDVRRGRRRVGWPVARRAARFRKDPLAAVQLEFLRRDDPGVGGPVDAHEAELETSLGEAADVVSQDMPSVWRRRMRAAARAGVAELPAELGEAVAAAVGDPERSPGWWRTARMVQYALLTVAGVALLWALASLVGWLGGGITGLRLFDDPMAMAYAGAVAVAGLLVGWLTGVGCGNLVEVAAVQRREDVERDAQGRVREIAGLRVVAPMEEELARYRAFRAAYEVARPRE